MEDKKLELRLGPPGDDQSSLLSLGFNSSMPSNSSERSNSDQLTHEKQCKKCRMAMGTGIGWPPICSFRKNLATSSSPKAALDSQNKASMQPGDRKAGSLENSLFVKIHMDGVPIGRKIDLKAYNNYQTLSSAVDELFRCLLAAQMNHSARVKQEEVMVESHTFSGLLDGSGEYTLVYEDKEGDRMLVGDVPWPMFVSTATRLRVLRRSELSSLQLYEF
ncbi:auxin-responsive protein IAA26-like [Diospyros lotus]|uniref:auxin-responsive protein IAA26-like n=1 Tax=Diospyros lotus TaxID=55363 RepID=UPI0022553348|nr:auxin-responsive protein IAA26-like [Diospyros lotus]XP_052210407.1 auxin-responsive protein IAA26-like [Diospyros lotus]XP_052210408.1 auxin-responsive protein IAA26-like [Diospyros lotus]